MADERTSRSKPTKRGAANHTAPRPALTQGTRRTAPGEPGSGQGRVDVIGIIPEAIRIDPDLTEGHPGYERSGDSEIIPTERFSESAAPEKNEAR
jgi:hypothetical protein